jgi:cysteinyl-tRNA synthetase
VVQRTQPGVPPEVLAAAEARAAARAARDWPTADRLRAEIEASGWKVVDDGTAFRLAAAHPPDVAADGETRYGRSVAVPSRLAEPATHRATVVVVAREDLEGSGRAVGGLLHGTDRDVQLLVVEDGLTEEEHRALGEVLPDSERIEVVRTSASLGQGAALNVGLRRSGGTVVAVLDASIEPTGDVVSPLVAALDDPSVAIAGPLGLASSDLRHFEEVATGPAAAIEGYLMAFRRADAATRGPLDEAFRFYRNLDVWWSLVLRDEGPGRDSRRAAVVEGLPLVRHEHLAWAAMPPAERDRLSKRNFYRVLDRFRDRLDLAQGH